MKDIVKFCDDTILEIGALINTTEVSLKQYMEKEEFRNIKGTYLKSGLLKRNVHLIKYANCQLCKTYSNRVILKN